MASSGVDTNTELKLSEDELDKIVNEALTENENSDTKNGSDSEQSQAATPSTGLYRFWKNQYDIKNMRFEISFAVALDVERICLQRWKRSRY